MYTCLNPQLESSDYSKMNTNGDGDEVVGDVDDTQSSLDPDGGEDPCPSASSPSRSFSKVRFLRVLLSTNVEYLIRLYLMKVFDKVVRLTHATAGRYGQAMTVPLVTKESVT
jgi:hypothetical protein